MGSSGRLLPCGAGRWSCRRRRNHGGAPRRSPVGGDDIAEQTREALRRVESALSQAGASLRDVIRTRIFVTDIARWREVGLAHGEFFGDIRPAATMVEVSALIDPALLVEIEADAIVG